MPSLRPNNDLGESAIQQQILEYLQFKGIFCWRNAVGSREVIRNGKKKVYMFGKKGISDILGVMPDGRFLAIEVKTKKGKTSQYQTMFLNDVANMGGVAFVARSIDDVDFFFKHYGYKF